MRRSRVSVAAALFTLCPFASDAEEVPSSYAYWVGNNTEDPAWTHSGNWYEGVNPANDGTTSVFFDWYDYGSYFSAYPVLLDTDVDLASLYISGTSGYYFSADKRVQATSSLTIRDSLTLDSYYSALSVPLDAPSDLAALSVAYSDYYNYSGPKAYFDSSVEVFADDTDWNIFYGEMEVAGTLHSSSEIRKYGDGTLVLSADNTASLSGQVSLLNGELGLAHDNALGTAKLVVGPQSAYIYPGLIAMDGERTIANDIDLTNYLATYEDDYGNDHTTSANQLTLTGTVTLLNDVTIENYGGILSFGGDIVEANPGTSILISSDDSPVLFAGNSGFTGGLTVDDGAAIFYGGDALPAAGLLATSQTGYIGLLESTIANQATALADFLALFDPTNTEGAIGFDTDPSDSTVNSYGGDIDLTGFTGGATLGSVTVAELTGTITPAGSEYRFGGGGGQLRIGSILTDVNDSSTGVRVVSESDRPLTVFLNSSANTFSGTVTVQHSALIFGNAPGTLPSGATLNPTTGGYIGLQDTTLSISSYLAQYAANITAGFIGFDSIDSATPRVISDAIDLTRFTASGPEFYLASSTNVTLSGAITLPAGVTAYRFAGYKGGSLTIASNLTDGSDPATVVIGDSNVPATGTFSNNNSSQRAVVTLTGTNTYSGGTSFNNGGLILGNASALGTGALEIYGNAYGFSEDVYYSGAYDHDETKTPGLRPAVDGLDLANAIGLYSNLIVDVPDDSTDLDFTLSGVITGSGALIKTAGGTLHLGGDNDFTGGLLVEEGTLSLDSDTAAGASPILFSQDPNTTQQVDFTSATPTIIGLHDNNWNADGNSNATVNLAAGTHLTIDPQGYELIYNGVISGAGSLEITGDGMQVLAGTNTFTGGTTISGGAIVGASNLHAFGSGTPNVTLNNATLFLEANTEVMVNLSFGADGGKIGGNGRLTFTNPLAFATNVRVAPGSSVGHLELNGPVEFASGGSMDIEIGDGDSNNVIADFLGVASLNFTATALSPFTLNLTGEDGVVPYQFDATQYYSWIILGADNTITNFDLDLIDLQVASNLLATTSIGKFYLSIGSGYGDSNLTNNALVLNFTPVPEPSTYALFGLGLALVGWHAWRRRRTA